MRRISLMVLTMAVLITTSAFAQQQSARAWRSPPISRPCLSWRTSRHRRRLPIVCGDLQSDVVRVFRHGDAL